MSLWERLKGEFIDIIEWLDDSQDTMVWRFPRYENEIKNGAQLVVRETQMAAFVNEGRAADIFSPGTYTLSTQNLPILSSIRGWKYGFESPFKAEVYFVNTKVFTNQKWGTKNPFMLRDAEFGPIRLRSFGNYSIRVKDVGRFIEEVVGTNSHFTIDDINEELRNIILTRFTDAVAESKIPILDLAANYDDLSKFIHQKIAPEFENYGLELVKFLIENMSLPPEVEEAIDKRSKMGILGDLNKYMQFQTAEAIEKAAENPSGMAGMGAGMGAGFGMVNQMLQNMQQQQQQQQQQKQDNEKQDHSGSKEQTVVPPPLPPQLEIWVGLNGQISGPFNTAKLKELAIAGQLQKDTLVWKKGMAEWIPAAQLTETADLLSQLPPPLA